MGEDPARRADEVAALRLGIELGVKLIDTAEMYADAEAVVGEAVAGRRDEVLIVSKVLPQNASYEGTLQAAERSLRRLGTDRIDLYLLHWPGSHPLEKTYAAFERLIEEGKIRHAGVSNFDANEMAASEKLAAGPRMVTNQVLYNLQRRGIERRLLPWCREREVAVMAYSPVEQARLPAGGVLADIAAEHGRTPYQIAVAWTIREPGVVTIPKATQPAHVRENAVVAEIELSSEDVRRLDAAFPAPGRDVPLDIL
jgi:diketogulonate reductase-like aldo/keto reductase